MNIAIILFSLCVSRNVAFQMNNSLSSIERFKKLLNRAKNIVVITGAGISVESGIPLLQGPDAYYRNRETRLLRTVEMFEKNPSLSWEFFNHRRGIIFSKKPNKAHYALVEFEKRCQEEGRNFTLITQNTDELHRKAGSQNLIQMYGTEFRLRCTVCGDITRNLKYPITPAFTRRRVSNNITRFQPIPISKLPRCEKTLEETCGGLLRPDIVFFAEEVDSRIGDKIDKSLRSCDICLIIGSSNFFPVNALVNDLIWRKVPVAEFNTESTSQTSVFQFHFEGPCTKTVPEAVLAP